MSDLNELIDRCSYGTHNSVAKLMKALYSDKFVCTIDNKSVTWYMRDGKIWRQSPRAIDLVKKMSNELVVIYCERVNFLNDAMGADDLDEETCNDMVTKTSKLCDLINNLGKTSFKDNVLKECQEEFYVPDFRVTEQNIKEIKAVKRRRDELEEENEELREIIKDVKKSLTKAKRSHISET